jgi:outer membrane protein assembly factor BamB
MTAYALPGLTTRWQISPDVDLAGAWVSPYCGAVLCVFRPTLVALDPATGKTRWVSDRWNYAESAGDYLAVSPFDGASGEGPLAVLDPATGRVRAVLGGWHQIFGPDDALAYVVHPGRTSLFGRFDPAHMAVRILGTTDRDLGRCDAGAGAVVCHLTGGAVAIWQPGR